MKKFFCVSVLFSFLFIISSCTSTPQDYADVDIGEKPTLDRATFLIQSYLERELKDPDSLKDFVLTSEVKRGLVNYGLFGNKGAAGKRFENPIWYVCAEYNAVNSYGGYTGLKNYAYFILFDELIDVREGYANELNFGETKWNCVD